VAAVEEDHPVTLRGVYYRVVSAGAVDKTETDYRLVGRELLKLRRARQVPYNWITDGSRWVVRPTTWTDLDEMLYAAGSSYRRALWHDQSCEVHVFTEKDAISGVIAPVTRRWDVPLGVLRGYASESFAWSMAEEIRAADKPVVYVYQLGDHDPSGLDAWRDFRMKVSRFLPNYIPGLDSEDGTSSSCSWREDPGCGFQHVHFERLAVLGWQIDLYELPTRPTKQSDTRARGFAGESVEVDAIRAPAVRELLNEAIEQHIDPEALRLTREVEQSERDIFERMRGGMDES
jgi:hypothetical protein